MNDPNPKIPLKIVKPKPPFSIGDNVFIKNHLFRISTIKPKKLVLKLLAKNVKLEDITKGVK